MLKQIWSVYSLSIQESFGAKLSASEVVELTRIIGKALDQIEST